MNFFLCDSGGQLMNFFLCKGGSGSSGASWRGYIVGPSLVFSTGVDKGNLGVSVCAMHLHRNHVFGVDGHGCGGVSTSALSEKGLQSVMLLGQILTSIVLHHAEVLRVYNAVQSALFCS